MKQVNIGMIGGGTVGSGVFNALQQNSELIEARTGIRLVVRKVAVTAFDEPRPYPITQALMTLNWKDVVEDPDIQIVTELVGGTGIAKVIVLAALQAGKAVVTANKALLSAHGPELFAAAKKAGTNLYYEASVAGGIPIIKTLREALVGNRFERIYGIVNGTCNYILTRMTREGAPFDAVLADAQRLGYAEADPSEDVGGKDAAAKMAILASIGFHSRTRLDDVDYEGITGVTAADIAHGQRLGLVAKLLGVAKLIDGSMNVRVYPAFIPRTHPLAGVVGAYNAVFLESDAFDKIMLFGPGAGSVPTASAVIGDIISVVNTVKGSFVQNCLCYKERPFFPGADMVSSFYLRMQVSDQPGVLAKIAALFGDHGVSIASMVQEGGGEAAELVLLLHPVREAQFFTALEKMTTLPEVLGAPAYIRVEGDA
jgi:homoserine dehydrogenase